MEKKVLIVDDQYGIRILLSELLKKEGYKTYQASNGVAALEIVKKEDPALIILDLKMPGMDGIEVFKEIKAMESNAKVIFMTAYGELQLINEFMELGALTHFTKPFDIEEVAKTVKKELPLKQGNKEIHTAGVTSV
ncbi:response regulator [Pseudalkalibacillus caeni]|uniref:Response regulator n=1 Tax=Exobacillus caeni TaxID=2574798 RepID=A0A5R9FHC3_9BACL|nr:response regulator [Pseudalkalibacillus caeni]TLS38965.1 response regulator [Pseudalkalibacillus caeni]